MFISSIKLSSNHWLRVIKYLFFGDTSHHEDHEEVHRDVNQSPHEESHEDDQDHDHDHEDGEEHGDDQEWDHQIRAIETAQDLMEGVQFGDNSVSVDGVG